jgi:hypothetical protein
MAFDVNAARKAGYSEVEIAEYLGQQNKFDAAGAIKAGYNPAELIDYLSNLGPKQSTIGSELVGGAKRVISSGRTGLGSIFTPEESAKAGVARSEEIGKEAGEGASFEALKKAYEREGLLGAAKELPSQASRALAGQAANLAAMAGGARLGAMAGAPLGPAGVIGGGILGAGATLLPQFMGSNVERQAAEQMEAGKDVSIDRTKAYTGAAAQAALESAGTAFTLGKRVVKGVLGVADDAAIQSAKAQAELVKAAERSLAASAGRGAARGLVEIPVEISQQIVERYQAGLDLTSPEALKEYGESAYQATLIGTPLGGAGGAMGRSRARAQLEQQNAAEARAEQERIAGRGAQLPPEAPVGTQGALFTEEEMGKRVPAPKEAPITQPAAIAPRGEQLGLGLDFQRDYADIVKEREALKQQSQTPEVKARVAELNNMVLGLHEQEVAAIRAEKQVDAETRDMFPGLAAEPAQQGLFPELDVVRPDTAIPEPIRRLTLSQEQARRRLEATDAQAAADAAQKEQERRGGQYRLPLRNIPEDRNVGRNLRIPARPDEITMQDLEDLGLPMRSAKGWLQQNVVGKTPAEIRVLVGNNPDLLLQKGTRAQVLKYLTAPVPESFKEEPRVTTPTKTNLPKPRPQPRRGEPSVGVSGEPTSAQLLQPGSGVPTAAGAPATLDGLGLAPAGQPIGTGVNATGAAKPALETKEERRARLRAEKAEREERTSHEVSIDGKPVELEIVRDKTKPVYKGNYPVVELRIKGLYKQPITIPFQGYQTDAEVIAFLRENDSIDDTPSPVTPAAPVAKPAVATEPTTKTTTTKKVEAPAPAVTAETVEVETAEEEATRKREAEDFKRRLEALEKKVEKPALKAEAPVPTPKAEKPAAKEIPEKLREPVGTSEFGMEEGEKEIVRGPQGMLFPMSKREEIEYAERKETKAEEAPAEEAPTKDERQAELDFTGLPKWATKYDSPTSTTIYADADTALVREHNTLGQYVYVGRAKNGDKTRVDIERYTGKLFTDEQKAKLIDERAKAIFAESKKFAKNPDGPFTGAKTNVAKSDSVDQRYADYLHGLMQELGLGNVRIFLVNPEDMAAPNAVEKYKLYKDYASVKTAGQDAGEEGSKRTYGPERRDFYISFIPGMSENKTLEVISHELGHAIQNIAYDNAPQETKDAIKAEYEQWLASTKGKTGRELIQMLRNRETADTQMMSVRENQPASELRPYWTSFNEWFADNVSRWASTNEKPLSVTEKFFSKVAQMMRDLVAVVTGRKYPPAKTVADFLNKMGPDDAKLWLTGKDDVVQPSTRAEFSINPSTEALIDSMGPLDRDAKSTLTKWVDQAKSEPDIGYVTKFRTQVTDTAATIEKRLSDKFDGAVRDSMGNLNPMGLYRQAQDYTKMLLEYFQTGTLYKEPATGLWKSGVGTGVRPPAQVYALLDKYAEKNGYSRDRATQIASRVLEGVRLNEMRASNKSGLTNFRLHLNDAQIDQLLKEYNADPDLKEMSKLMDEARIAMVNNLVKVGRLSAEQGKEWREVVGYVPFDRLEDFATKYSSAKKISGKGISQLGKLPELIGSDVRPVGNVFDNYINTLGWMVGQTMKTDATVQTLKSLQDLGFAKKLGNTSQGNPNVVSGYVDGELNYWSVPSKYDVLAFKDLNPPKAGWLRAMGAFSNVLRKTVTILPPFALKQVTDDVQRAILTSGVRNPGALVWMSLTNFPKLAFAELRGIQHPIVKDFGRLGLTGEYDFEAGKPASSLLKDLGYKKRGKFEELVHRLDGITRASDLAVRKAIYDQTLKETQGNELLAQTRAREFINFRRRGANDFVGAMVTTIPFFNAYIQGMDVLYRAASGKDSSSSVDRAQARQLFWSRASTVMMLSSLYALGMDDEDEDYKEMDLRTRDGNWILPGGYKLPVPGELGAIFKVIPERIVEYMKRQGTPEEQTAFEAMRTTLAYMYEQYLGRAVPVPQAIKPVLEAWANKSFLTGRDLEGYHHRAMDPSMRMTEQTSELAKAISKFSRDQIGVEVSPIMIDNAMRGYFGSTAAITTMVTDSLLNPTRVDRPLHKYALLSNYLYDPVGTRRMTEFYEEREKVGKANTTLNELMKTDLARAEKYVDEHADELQLEGAINSTLEQLERTRAYRKFLNSPDGAADMSKEDREAELKELKQIELSLVGWVREAKTELRKAQ